MVSREKWNYLSIMEMIFNIKYMSKYSDVAD
jgi:hypothetical protein